MVAQSPAPISIGTRFTLSGVRYYVNQRITSNGDWDVLKDENLSPVQWNGPTTQMTSSEIQNAVITDHAKAVHALDYLKLRT
jgi:hypothetical protein